LRFSLVQIEEGIWMKARAFSLCIATLWLGSAMASDVGVRYQVIDLGTLGGGYSVANSVNDAGQVVGSSANAQNRQCAYVYRNGHMVALPSLSQPSDTARSINSLGQVTGTSVNALGYYRAVRWDPQASGEYQVVDLGTLEGTEESNSGGFDINDDGVVCGLSDTENDIIRAATFAGSVRTNLGALSAGSSVASAINNNGLVVGSAYDIHGRARPYYKAPGGAMTALSFFGGAKVVSDSGVILGFQEISGKSQAFSWINGSMTSLGAGLSSNSFASSINTHGEIVGYFVPQTNVNHAYYWGAGNAFDLNDAIDPGSGWVLSTADGINNSGVIVGSGFIHGAQHGYMLVGVPEPAMVALVTVATLCLLTRRTKRGQ
jgi:probable HAF family extracellular repeat protein